MDSGEAKAEEAAGDVGEIGIFDINRTTARAVTEFFVFCAKPCKERPAPSAYKKTVEIFAIPSGVRIVACCDIGVMYEAVRRGVVPKQDRNEHPLSQQEGEAFGAVNKFMPDCVGNVGEIEDIAEEQSEFDVEGKRLRSEHR